MQTFKNVRPYTIDKFVTENNGNCIDVVEGTLIDNVVYSFSFGTLFCFETYANEWQSNYTMYFFHKDREKGINKMWDKFNALKAE